MRCRPGVSLNSLYSSTSGAMYTFTDMSVYMGTDTRMRLSIKIMFPVKRPGDYKSADWGLFFSFLQFFVFFFHIIFSYFSPPPPPQKKKNGEKNGEKNNCGRPTGHNFSHPLDRKQTFFYGQPEA